MPQYRIPIRISNSSVYSLYGQNKIIILVGEGVSLRLVVGKSYYGSPYEKTGTKHLQNSMYEISKIYFS